MRQRQLLLALALAGSPLLFGHTAYAAGTPSLSLELISSPPATPGSVVSFAAGASGFTNPIYTLSDSFAGSSASSGDIDTIGYFSWTPTLYDAGLHQITVSVSDTYGDSASATISILVASNVILLQNLAPGFLVGISRPVSFSIVAPGYISPFFTLSDSYPGTSISGANIDASGNFSWTPSVNQQGTHSIVVYARDAYGHSASIPQTIVVTNPEVDIASVQPGMSAPAGSPLTFRVVPSGFATSTTFSASDTFSGTSTLPASPIDGSGNFSWTPGAGDIGSHAIAITVSDAYGNQASVTRMFTITPAAPAPVPAPSPIAPTTSTTPPVPNPSPSPAGDGYIFLKPLAIGASGTAVLELQERLTLLGFYSGPVTGYYGVLTAGGVRAFQAAHGLSQVGNVGPLTRAALNHS